MTKDIEFKIPATGAYLQVDKNTSAEVYFDGEKVGDIVVDDLLYFDNYVSLDKCINCVHGETISVPVYITNTRPVTNLQFDITLYKNWTNFSLEGIEKTDRAANVDISYKYDFSHNVHTLTLTSNSGGMIMPGCGPAFYLNVFVPSEDNRGNPIVADPYASYGIDINNARMTVEGYDSFPLRWQSCNIHAYDAANLPVTTLGDVNNDGEISIPDVSMTVEYVLGREPNGGVREAADVNEDGEISIPDVSMIVSYILAGRTVQSRALQMREKKAEDDVEYDECLFCSEISTENGNRHWLRLGLTDAADYTSAQFDVILPQGMKVVDARMAEENTSHMVTFSEQEDGVVRVLTYSLKNKNFRGFVDMLVECTTGSAYEVEICNVRLASKEDDAINSYRAEGLTIGLDATGIAGTPNAGNAIDVAYDLSGRKVNDTYRLPKGVYIVNGKKVIKK